MRIMRITFALSLILLAKFIFAQNALNFDSINDYVQTTFTGISGNAARTVEAWIRTTANCDPNNGGGQKVIVDWGYGTPNGSRFTFNLLNSNSIRIEVAGNGLSGTTAVNDGYWHHVAVTYNPSLTTNQYKLYIDGNLETQGNLTVATNTLTTVPVRIGCRVDNVKYFLGDIDEVRIWNVVRSQTELQLNKNIEFCTPQTGLVAYFKFNQGIASGNNANVTTLTEQVAGNNGSLQNFALTGNTSNWVSDSSLSSGLIIGDTANITACDSYTIGGIAHTSSGIFHDTISSAWGCDSAITVNLTINQSTSDSIGVIACNSYLSPSGNYTWAVSGLYTDTISNAANCDSVIKINLTIVQINTNVGQSGNVLNAYQSNASYQWLDCNNNFAIIPGAIGQTFYATANGSYAVAITKDGCNDTSLCYTVTTIGMGEFFSDHVLRIIPNPNNGQFTIDFGKAYEEGIIEIIDITGRTVLTSTIKNTSMWEVNSMLESGLYQLRIRNNKEILLERIIIR